jgi:hypothetical protein
MAYMPAPAEGGKALSVSGHAKAEAAPAPHGAATPPPIPQVPVAQHPAASKMSRPAPAATGEARVGMGIVGGIIGTVLGAFAWYLMAVGGEGWRVLAWVPGICGGFLARGMAKKISDKVGYVTCLVSAIVTISTQLAVVSAINEKRLDEAVQETYQEKMGLAKRAADAKNDKEIREVMADDSEGGFEFKELDQIDDAAVAKYRTTRLASLQKFAKGEPSKSKFLESERQKLAENHPDPYEVGTFSWIVWVGSSIYSALQIPRGRRW